jgi:hypothetical protein
MRSSSFSSCFWRLMKDALCLQSVSDPLPNPQPNRLLFPGPKALQSEAMQLASRPAFPEPLLAAMWQLSENSRLGFRVAGSTLHQGFGAGKYLIGIGDTASVVPSPWPESLKAQQQVGDPTLPTSVNEPPPSLGDRLMKEGAEQAAIMFGTDGVGDIIEAGAALAKGAEDSQRSEKKWTISVAKWNYWPPSTMASMTVGKSQPSLQREATNESPSRTLDPARCCAADLGRHVTPGWDAVCKLGVHAGLPASTHFESVV